MVSTLVLSIFGVYQLVQNLAEFEAGKIISVVGMMTNSNLFSEYLVLLLPFQILGILWLNKPWQVLSIASLAGSIFLILIIMGRGAWLGLLSGLFLTASAFTYFSSNWGSKKFVRPILAAAGLLVLSVVGLDNFVQGGLSDKFLSILQPDMGTAGLRLRIWQQSLNFVQENPFLGIGAGMWKVLFQQYGMANSSDTFIAEPLNDYVGMAAEIGLFGTFAFVALIAAGLVKLLRNYVAEKNVFDLAVFASVIGFAVTAFFSFPLHRIEHGSIFIFCLAWADRSKIEVSSSRLRTVLLVFLLFISAFAIYVGSERYLAETHVKQALIERNGQRWNNVISDINKVNLEMYPMEPSTTPVVWYRGLAYFQIGDREKALQDFELAYEVNPYHVHVLNNIATCHAMNGDLDRAVSYYKKALAVNDRFPDALMNLIAVLIHQKKQKEAVELIDASPVFTGGPREVRAELKKIRRELTGQKRRPKRHNS
ncbi:MAG: O-antigen ligase family protein [Flavobacteriales bacterium]|nr:O-antigen ligase family protein [Flavobacteriales bacterium]MCB9190464.1 O-antigen ligase family protein [Flavobacteriales bacterium]MCB9205273.1 O-antigen ligase family protein [Flavobacteriales bacterium]